MDTLNPDDRSKLMSRVRCKDTSPEIAVRRFLHGLGYRYRLHARDLPGTPDLLFSSRRIAVFVHGCFWHRHEGCRLTYSPKSRREFWQEKFNRNVSRDERVREELQESGWTVLIVWECDVRDGRLSWLPNAIEDASEPILKRRTRTTGRHLTK